MKRPFWRRSRHHPAMFLWFCREEVQHGGGPGRARPPADFGSKHSEEVPGSFSEQQRQPAGSQHHLRFSSGGSESLAGGQRLQPSVSPSDLILTGSAGPEPVLSGSVCACRTISSLGVLTGAQLFSLNKEELKTVCPDDGARVFSQVTVQKAALEVGGEPGRS